MKRFGMILMAGLGALVLASCSTSNLASAQQQQAECFDLQADPGTRVLVFSHTAAFRHASIPTGVAAVRALGERHGFEVEETADPGQFNDARLSEFDAVVFMSTTGNLFDAQQKAALERYMRGGGGFVGVHAASDAEKEWGWYRQLVGAYFQRHPQIQPATIRVIDRTHLSTRCLPEVWTRTDEWYDFDGQPDPGMTVLANLDESSYQGGRMGDPHPILWYREFQGGRSWYTALGHTDESYSEPEFLDHLAGGILWATGKD